MKSKSCPRHVSLDVIWDVDLTDKMSDISFDKSATVIIPWTVSCPRKVLCEEQVGDRALVLVNSANCDQILCKHQKE